ncbi:MAG: hypothetical protein NTY19_07755, partial [Planctomycetota bacterium]|nr:hypothetical protein [Planctomycetota bacterium]
TRLEASVANRLCQAERQIAGTVSARGVQVGSQRICEGDRVLFHNSLRRHGVENGFRGTVVGVDSVLGNMTVRLDHEPSPQARAKGHRQTITVPVREFSPEILTLAYAATTHKMQGQSISKAYVLLGGAMTDMQMSYVQATRGQDCTRIFVDELHAGESLQDLARSMTRSRAKDLAHDVMRQGRQPARLEHRLQHEPS